MLMKRLFIFILCLLPLIICSCEAEPEPTAAYSTAIFEPDGFDMDGRSYRINEKGNIGAIVPDFDGRLAQIVDMNPPDSVTIRALMRFDPDSGSFGYTPLELNLDAYVSMVSYSLLPDGGLIAYVNDPSGRLIRWDSEGRQLYSQPAGQVAPTIKSYVNILASSDGKLYFLQEGSVWVTDLELKPCYKLTLDENMKSPALLRDPDGTVLLSYASDGSYMLRPFDDEGKRLGSELRFQPDTGGSRQLLGADGGIYCRDSEGLYAVDGKGRKTRLFDWLDVDLTADMIYGVGVISSERIAVYINDPFTGKNSFAVVSAEDDDYIPPEREILRLACDSAAPALSADVKNYIRAFNVASETHRIELEVYQADKKSTALDKLLEDIKNGHSPDLLLFGGAFTPTALSGYLADLYPMLESEYRREDFQSCALKSAEIDGRLCALTLDYTIKALSGQNLADSSRLTPAQLTEMNAALGEGQALFLTDPESEASSAEQLMSALQPLFVDSDEPDAETLASLRAFCDIAECWEYGGEPIPYCSGKVWLRLADYDNALDFLSDRDVYFPGGVGIANAVLCPLNSFGVIGEDNGVAWRFISGSLELKREAVERNDMYTNATSAFPSLCVSQKYVLDSLKSDTFLMNFSQSYANGHHYTLFFGTSAALRGGYPMNFDPEDETALYSLLGSIDRAVY